MSISSPTVILILLSITVMEHVTRGKVPDATLASGTSSSLVVESVLHRISTSCIFQNGGLFLRRLAYRATRDGTYDCGNHRKGNNGGIWQVGREAFQSTHTSNQARSFYRAIESKFGIDWTTVPLPDLRKPLVSAMATALYMTTIPDVVPLTRDGQAYYYQKYFRFNRDAPHVFRSRVLLDDGPMMLHLRVPRSYSDDDNRHKSYNILLYHYKLPNICDRNSPSYQPHPKDDTKFVMCRKDGVMYVFQCVPGYVYISGSRECIPKDSVNPVNVPLISTAVSVSSPVSDSSTPSRSDITPTASSISLGHSMSEPSPRTTQSVTDFIIRTPSTSVKPISTKQPATTTLLMSQQNHESPSLPYTEVPSQPPSVHLTGSGVLNPCRNDALNDLFYYPHPGDKRKYIHCDGAGNAHEVACPGNSIWHQDLLQCIPNALFFGQP